MTRTATVSELLDEAVALQSKTLVLRNLGVTELPDRWQAMQMLTAVHASRNKLRTSPPSFAQLSNLEELDLRKNELSYVPLEILSLPKLRVLNLSDNRITSLDGVDQLSGLESLDISFNRVRHLPQGLSSLPRLKTLDLSANSLAGFPLQDGDYPVLEELRLSGNPISFVPSQLWSHPKLEWLYLDPEQAKAVPAHVRSRGRPVIQVE